MIPNITRGGSAARALAYDASRGHAGEHQNARLIDGSESVRFAADFRRRRLSSDVRREVADAIEAPRQEWGREVRSKGKPAHIWRCSLTLDQGEKLTDNQWASVGRRFVKEMGFEDCEWALIHHGGSGREKLDHVHLTVNVIQASTGKTAKLNHDRHRAQAATARIAREMNLTELAGHQRYLPAQQRRAVGPRQLTNGIRHALLERLRAAGRGATVQQLRERGVLARRGDHADRAGWAYALAERPDVWVTRSDLNQRLREDRQHTNTAAQAKTPAPKPTPKLSPAVARPATGYQPPAPGRGHGR